MIDPQAVADYLDLPVVDARLQQCSEAASMWVMKRRHSTPAPELWADGDVVLGTIMYASLLYQAKASPQGFAEYEDISAQFGAAMAGIYRLVGGVDPVAV